MRGRPRGSSRLPRSGSASLTTRLQRSRKRIATTKSFLRSSPRDQWLAVHRRDYQVYWTTLDEPGYQLLGLLVQGGVLGEAIEQTCLKYEGRVGESEIFSWFQDWVSQGLFQSVETA